MGHQWAGRTALTPAQQDLKATYTWKGLNHLERKGCVLQMISSTEATSPAPKRKMGRCFPVSTACALLSIVPLAIFHYRHLQGVGLHQLFLLALRYHETEI